VKRLPTVVLLLGSLTGCALLTKSEPVEPRYFTPESGEGVLGPRPVPPPVSGDDAGAPRRILLRIGRVGGGSYLKERIVYRDSDHELGFYENRRWTERPEIYLQRAIEHAFFEERGVERALTGAAPTLTADLIDFEEVRGPHPGVRLRLSYALHDDRAVLRERTFTVDRQLANDSGASRADLVASALGDALREAVTEIVDQVLADLAKQAAE
jgi:cholesterol transport system auxiliary component